MRAAASVCAVFLSFGLLLIAEEPGEGYRRPGPGLDQMPPLDVASIVSRTPAEAGDAARRMLGQILRNPDASLELHVLYHLGTNPDPVLLAEARKIAVAEGYESATASHAQLNALGLFIDDLGDREAAKLEALGFHNRGTVRNQALDLMARSGSERFLPVFERTLAAPVEPSNVALAWAGIARADSSRRDRAVAELKKILRDDDASARWLAARHLADLGESASFPEEDIDDPVLANAAANTFQALVGEPYEEEALFDALRSSQHDLRVRALEVLAKNGSPEARERIVAMGNSGSWHARMLSAFYLHLTASTHEAHARLATETHPMVQVTLLSALLAD